MIFKIPFQFESIVRLEEDSNLKIELSTSQTTPLDFSLILKEFHLFRELLYITNDLIISKLAPITNENIRYKDWYASEIISRITSKEDVYTSKPDSVKEVLKELVERRNKLSDQIKEAMEYYNSTKGDIDIANQIRANYWKIYSPPMLTLSDNTLFFESLSEFNDLYLQIGMNISDFFNFETEEYSPVLGNGWIEYSKNFSDDIQSIFQAKTITVTNSKPRTDPRVLGRSDLKIAREYDLNSNWILNFQHFNSLLFYFEKNKIRSIRLNLQNLNIYEIVNQIHNSFGKNKKLMVTLEYNTNNSLKLDLAKNCLYIRSNSLKVNLKVEFQLNSSLFKYISRIARYLNEIEIIYYGAYLPIYLKCNFKGGYIMLSSNIYQRARELEYRIMLEEFMRRESELINKDIENLNPSNSLYNASSEELQFRKLIDKDNTNLINSKQEIAIVLFQVFKKFFKYENQVITLTTTEFSTTLAHSNSLEISEMRCSCEQNSERYNCAHILSCILFLLLEVRNYVF